MEELGIALKQRRSSDEERQEPWNKLVKAWEKRTQESKSNVSRRDLRLSSRDASQGWSIEKLEASMAERKKTLANVDYATMLNLPLQHVSLDDEPTALDDDMVGVTDTALQLQILNRSDPILSRADMLPLPIPLRPRISRRCRAELAQGRPGILLKPKLNPLEGDSSLRSGHGQWFKKVRSTIGCIFYLRCF